VKSKNGAYTALIISGTLFGWFALIAQLYLIIHNRTGSVPETIIRYFSYFTILTNILAALFYTVSWLGRSTKFYKYIWWPPLLTAITVYMSVVGLVYQVLLRPLWSPTGLQLIVDEILHSVQPVLTVIFWWMFADTSHLSLKGAIRWLSYPLAYLIFILIRGSLSGFYPYPFIDVITIGYPTMLVNSVALMAGFLFLSGFFIWIGKRRGR